AALMRRLSASFEPRMVVLIDEVEPVVATSWGRGFFGNWRYLLSNDPDTSPYLSVLFSGAKEMTALADDVGSPIANILTVRQLRPLTWAAIQELANNPTGGLIPPGVVRKIFVSTGGHPYLAQYLLHHICEFDLNDAAEHLAEAEERFLQAEQGQFVNWW